MHPSAVLYLSNILWICHQLEPYFPKVQEIRKSHLIHHSLEGCKHLRGSPTVRKQALTIADLNTVCVTHLLHPTHNDLLFCTQLCVRFFALMWLGELTQPDDTELWDPQKLTPHSLVVLANTSFKFFLPGHKADRFFEGNTIMLCANPFACNPLAWVCNYLHCCNTLFPLSSALWVRKNGTIPTRSFFM